MSNNILVIDPSVAGISGDMLLSASIDLGANEESTIQTILSIKNYFTGCKKLEVNFSNVIKNGFRAKKINMEIEETTINHNVTTLTRNFNECLSSITISSKAREFAENSFRKLIDVESFIHGVKNEDVHLHETASIDTFVDIIGTAFAMDNLKLFDINEIITTPVAIGRGDIKFSHGNFTAPSPAVLELAKENQLLIKGGPSNYEAATPTGMAMLAALTNNSQESYPVIKPDLIGIGAGTYSAKEFPNILRIIIGEKSKLIQEQIVMLETNIDDITGEELAYAIDKINAEGALDVSVLPIYGKKGRPAYILRAITNHNMKEYISNLIMQETGTLGIRIIPTSRYIQNREIINVNIEIKNNIEKLDIKVVKSESGDIISFKPEFEQMKKLALDYSMNFRELNQDIRNQVKKLFSS